MQENKTPEAVSAAEPVTEEAPKTERRAKVNRFARPNYGRVPKDQRPGKKDLITIGLKEGEPIRYRVTNGANIAKVVRAIGRARQNLPNPTYDLSSKEKGVYHAVRELVDARLKESRAREAAEKMAEYRKQFPLPEPTLAERLQAKISVDGEPLITVEQAEEMLKKQYPLPAEDAADLADAKRALEEFKASGEAAIPLEEVQKQLDSGRVSYQEAKEGEATTQSVDGSP